MMTCTPYRRRWWHWGSEQPTKMNRNTRGHVERDEERRGNGERNQYDHHGGQRAPWGWRGVPHSSSTFLRSLHQVAGRAASIAVACHKVVRTREGMRRGG